MIRLSFLMLIFLFLFNCQGSNQHKGLSGRQTSQPKEEAAMSLKIYSPAFDHGQRIPVKYTCDGPDLSPPLRWENLPEGTRSLVLICDDPDAPMGTWVHWVAYGISPELNGLDEHVPPTETVEAGFRQGQNSWGRLGYGGPCPPKGKPHRYFFKLFAVDIPTDWEAGLTKEEVEKRIDGHTLARAEWMGIYQR